MLEAEYLVESIPRRGVVVRKFTDEKIIEIYDCRIALESTAIRLFTEIANPKKLKELKGFFKSFIHQKEPIDAADYQLEDVRFHNFIIQHCGNSFLAKLFQQSNLLICINQIGLIRSSTETLPEHLKIIKAIENRDAELAVLLAKDHLLKSKKLIINNLKSEKLNSRI